MILFNNLNFNSMKNLIKYTKTMHSADPAAIPIGLILGITFYLIYFILIPLFY